jgi:hypothetical protein
MEISVKTIAHKNQPYDTVGYYSTHQGMIFVTVSDMKNEDYAFLVAMHELTEAYLTNKRGITGEDITFFDEMFELEINKGLHSDTAEPGDDDRAPYKKEHFFATNIERLIAAELGVDWNEYDKAVQNLGE